MYTIYIYIYIELAYDFILKIHVSNFRYNKQTKTAHKFIRTFMTFEKETLKKQAG